LAQGVALKHMTRHLLGLFSGMAGARQWRRTLTEQGIAQGADSSVIVGALDAIRAQAV